MTKLLLRAVSTVALGGAAAVALVLFTAQGAQGVTVAHWDFEDGVDGLSFSEDPDGGSVDTVGGVTMFGYDDYWGPSWTSATSDGTGLAMNNADNHQDGYTTGAGAATLNAWSPSTWTIETHVYLDEISGWETLIGRDGSSQAEPASDFYLSNNGIDDQFRIDIDTVGGERWVLDGEPAGGVLTNTWYGLAARSDGVTLSLWLDDGFTGYQQIGSLDISSQSVADNALAAVEADGTTVHNWTFGRGWYNGGFVDHIDGKMDNIRFSDVALDSGDLIPLEVVTPLALEVNTTTGEARIKNRSDAAIAIDYYRIDSPTDGALLTADYNGSTGWDSLDDQGIDPVDGGDDPGETWDEVSAAISANLLVEQFLLGDTTLDPNASVMLGAPVSLGLLDDDLEFRYGMVGGGLMRANVSYVTDFGGLDGDYNDDGTIDAADYTVWRDAMSAGATELTNDPTPGTVDETDYDYWKAHYGESAGAGAALGAATVPEPASALLLLLALAGCSAIRRS